MMHKINDISSILVDKLELMDNNNEFRDGLQEMIETYEDSMDIECKKIYPDADVVSWTFDYDYDDWEKLIADIIDYLCGKTLIDANINSIRDVITITLVTKGA